ncbi:hypothetical protein CROQUDRAFT_100758 [Cronartium quercuum f. sp. fusiforme G11]|uniref:Uncharacterized protein n=1 Tax=Cronartium quercuum f. sp. fusiforme G11 TaxID=708437 RepID=A0A9P6T717_9BASI|nr:hypothetical protein CROQUDRAFT_100758 [Cronartium quercuum f. sp. fusiforme G11]
MIIKDSSLYSGYQKSPVGWAVYKKYSGIRGQANLVLGAQWKCLTPEEKEQYHKYVGVPTNHLDELNNPVMPTGQA